MNTDVNTIRFLGAAQLIVIVGSLITERLLASAVGSGSISDILVKTPLKKPRLRAPVWVEAGASGARSGAIVKKRKQKDDCQAVA
jgi:hypothetical protein